MKKNKFKIIFLILTIICFISFVSSVEANEIGSNGYSICSEAPILKAFRALGYVLLIVKVVVPILIILFACIDLGKAVIASDDKEIKTATTRVIKRVVAGVIIYFLPTIINTVFDLVNGAEELKNSNVYCQKCLFEPNGALCSTGLSEN